MQNLSALRERWMTLFEDTLQAGREAERQATQSLVADMRSLLERAQAPTAPLQPSAKPMDARQTNPAQAKSYPSERARPGSVLTAVARYVDAMNAPVGPLAIVRMAESDGVSLNASSVRMALQTLRDRGQIRQIGRGDWEAVRQSSHVAGQAQPTLDIKNAPPSE